MSLKVKKSGVGHQHPASDKVAAVLTKEETKRLNVNVPKSFYRKVKAYAVANDTNITDMVVAALYGYMSK
ncbi:MAG: plasmid partition protein ParG [Candidatus Sedimenticola sp. (ex Thyasira tokunagai)]